MQTPIMAKMRLGTWSPRPQILDSDQEVLTILAMDTFHLLKKATFRNMADELYQWKCPRCGDLNISQNMRCVVCDYDNSKNIVQKGRGQEEIKKDDLQLSLEFEKPKK
jgi:hypothetical protein